MRSSVQAVYVEVEISGVKTLSSHCRVVKVGGHDTAQFETSVVKDIIVLMEFIIELSCLFLPCF